MPEDLMIESVQFSLAAWTLDLEQEEAPFAVASNGVAAVISSAAGPPRTYTVMSYDSIDIDGYTTLMDKTFYPASVALQRGFTYGWATPGALDACWDLVFVLPRKLTDTEQAELIALNYPSFIGTAAGDTSSIDKQHVMWGKWTMVTGNSTLGGYGTPVDGGTFGTGLPTLASRLWVYRFTHVQVDTGTVFNAPAYQGIIDGAFGKEPDMEYMERLRRTFVLASDLT